MQHLFGFELDLIQWIMTYRCGLDHIIFYVVEWIFWNKWLFFFGYIESLLVRKFIYENSHTSNRIRKIHGFNIESRPLPIGFSFWIRLVLCFVFKLIMLSKARHFSPITNIRVQITTDIRLRVVAQAGVKLV